jgi:hypothetical protein
MASIIFWVAMVVVIVVTYAATLKHTTKNMPYYDETCWVIALPLGILGFIIGFAIDSVICVIFCMTGLAKMLQIAGLS